MGRFWNWLHFPRPRDRHRLVAATAIGSDIEPTERAARQLAREARRLLAEGRPLEVVRRAALLLVDEAVGPRLLESRVDRLLIGRRLRGSTGPVNPVDARILSSVTARQGRDRVTPGRVNTDVFAILAVAQANWPHDPVAGSEAVWTKWAELLGPFRFDEVRDALTHWRAPIRGSPRSRNSARVTGSREAAARARGRSGGGRRWIRAAAPSAGLPRADYVIGPYSAAFAAMNAHGWSTERLIECFRAVDPRGGAQADGVCRELNRWL